MILVEVVALSVLLGLLCGGDLRRLGALDLRYSWLVIIAFVMQLYVVYTSRPDVVSGVTFSAVLLLSSYLNILVCCGINVRLPGMPIIIVGLLLNTVVIAGNWGFMPITIETIQQTDFLQAKAQIQPGIRLAGSKDIILPAADVRLGLLSDAIILSPPLPFRTRFTHTVFSLGDAVVALGAFIVIQAGLGSRLAILKVDPARS